MSLKPPFPTQDLVAAFQYPGPWVIGKPKLLGGADQLWSGADPPKPEDTDAALAAVDDPLAKAKQLFSR